LLQGTSRYLRDEKRWHTSHVDFPDLNYDLGIAVIGLALFLSTAAFVLPSISIDRITQLVQDVFSPDQDETSPVAESLGLRILAKPESSFKSVATPGLARQHLIGSGPELSEQVVMWVYPSGYNPVMASYQFPIGETLPAPPGYYWRSYSYDGYTGHGWYSTTYQENDRQSSEPIFLPDERLQSNGAFAHHRFAYLTEEVNNLYSPGELVFVDRPYQLAWRNPQDIFGARLASGEVAVTAQVPDASEQELRQAGRDYPDWLSRRYLALPENLPERVRDLALDLTATQPTPYDQAVAIERFLRTYPYTLDLPAPPTGRDVADYFLFDLQEGYCDYYATAMVVMARAAGLPARMAIGYATGQWHPMTGYFVVSEAEAHSWPEIYFPGHGWIAFEPTASLTPLIRSGEQKQGGNPTAVPPPLPSRVVLPNNLGNWSGYLLAFVGLIAGLLLLVEYADRWRLRHMPAQAAITLLYHRLGNHAQRLAVQPRFADTPAEFTNRLSSRLKALDPAGGDEYSDLPEEAIWLAEEYATARYSTHSPDRRKHLQIIQRWLKMRSQLRRVWLKSIRLPRK
jgi:transglutaminase-like putative cysteine protease